MNPSEIQLFYHPKDRLRMTLSDSMSYITVKPAWSAPLSRPGKFLALLNGKGDEITTIADPNELPIASLTAVSEELHRRYLTATVLKIVHAKVEYGATYWSADTSRGHRDFVCQSLQENAVWLSETHLLLIDVDGNRFELPDVTLLDSQSRHYIQSIL